MTHQEFFESRLLSEKEQDIIKLLNIKSDYKTHHFYNDEEISDGVQRNNQYKYIRYKNVYLGYHQGKLNEIFGNIQ